MKHCIYSYLLLSFVLPLTVGCQSLSQKMLAENASNVDFHPEFLGLMTPAFHELPAGLNPEAMQYLTIEASDIDLMSDNTSHHLFYALFFKILSLPVVEKPDYWVSIINNTNRSELLRLHCFRALFLRHIAPGDRLAKLAAIPNTELWFDEDTTSLVNGSGGGIRFKWRVDEDYIEIRMRSGLEEAHIPITLGVRGSKIGGENEYLEKKAEIIDLLRGQKKDPNLVITGIAVY